MKPNKETASNTYLTSMTEIFDLQIGLIQSIISMKVGLDEETLMKFPVSIANDILRQAQSPEFDCWAEIIYTNSITVVKLGIGHLFTPAGTQPVSRNALKKAIIKSLNESDHAFTKSNLPKKPNFDGMGFIRQMLKLIEMEDARDMKLRKK